MPQTQTQIPQPQTTLQLIYTSVSPEPTAVVLWVSRHQLLKKQIEVLEDKLGAIRLYQLSGMIPNAEFIIKKVREVKAQYVIPVLPLSMIARLTELARKEGFIVLWAEMQQIKVLDREPEPEKDFDPEKETYVKGMEGTYKIMRFKQFHKIKAIKLELEPF